MLGASLSSWEIMPHTILVCTGDIHVDGVLAAVLVIAWYLNTRGVKQAAERLLPDSGNPKGKEELCGDYSPAELPQNNRQQPWIHDAMVREEGKSFSPCHIQKVTC